MLIPLLVCAGVPFQYSFTIWDLDSSYRDFGTFKRQVNACAAHGFTVLELGAGWPDCEPAEGAFDFAMVDERLAYARAAGLEIRVRLNMRDWPAWHVPTLYQLPDGTPFPHHGGFPSLFDPANRERQLRFAGELAKHLAGNGYTYSPGFSVHMEVKFADWNSYEPAAQEAFRRWLAGRYESVERLSAAWGTELDSFASIRPPVPPSTQGRPSLDAADVDWIRFREQALADWVAAFAAVVRANDPTARVSVPLGESFRAGSAQMANHGYWASSRPADEIVHSYDFFWHGTQGLHNVRAAVATMVGITQRPVVFEVDGPYLFDHFGYTEEDYVEAARLVLDAGATGIQITNWGGVDIAQRAFLSTIGGLVKARAEGGPWNLPGSADVLYYVSKWQSYGYREPDEWVHDRQFALWFRLCDAGIPSRIVTDENLVHEDVRAKVMLLPFATVLDAPARDRLRSLSHGMAMIADDPPGQFVVGAPFQGLTGTSVKVTGTPFAEDPRAPADIIALAPPRSEALRVAAVQFETRFDVSHNAARILDYLAEAAHADARVVVFPEMALTGYSKEASFGDALDWAAVDAAVERIRAACRDLGLYAVFGAPTRERNARYCAALAVDPQGNIIDAYEKIYRAGERWADEGRRLSIFTIDAVRCATIICHDARYAPLVQLRTLAGAQLFFYLSCESGVAEEHKIAPYRAQVQARAVENGVYLVQANTPASREDPRAPDRSHGESRIVAPDGHILVEAPVYGDAMIVADLDIATATKGGRRAALGEGPLAGWMRQGVDRVRNVSCCVKYTITPTPM
ncbi:MAG TPA: nitrilase-related carbon-nitrogen hydrolase [Candidatus Hydrogenedentes bacterium]|nr:nitrilase-related carbon-nitrogen hydrolase [Candidatus Hydrogenedentota bacterium]HPG66727.1 nitrilase-related carbon-nitrogen hydrolase [Candidatus Hydrogenedentota bacterium]